MKIKELFDIISEKENHEFKINEFYEQKTKFEIPDENGNMVNVSGMIIKEDDVMEFTLENLQKVKVAKGHFIESNRGCLQALELNEGDHLKNTNIDLKIISIKNIGKETVYDLQVDSKSHLWQDEDGFIHHNTYTVLQKLKQAGASYRHLKGTIRGPLNLYKILYDHAESDEILVFDDLDSIFADMDSANILKGALDTTPPRKVGYFSTKLDQLDLPEEFDFNGRIIFISNLYSKDLPGALKSRSLMVELDMTSEQILERIESVLNNIAKDIPMKYRKEVLVFLKENSANFAKIDFRTFEMICLDASTESPYWKAWAVDTIEEKNIASKRR